MPVIACEGSRCNAGVSARDRERALVAGLPTNTAELRDEAERHARREVSTLLALTPHERTGTDGRGRHVYTCAICGHDRIYGSTDAHYRYVAFM